MPEMLPATPELLVELELIKQARICASRLHDRAVDAVEKRRLQRELHVGQRLLEPRVQVLLVVHGHATAHELQVGMLIGICRHRRVSCSSRIHGPTPQTIRRLRFGTLA